jgi:hypothetical protein
MKDIWKSYITSKPVNPHTIRVPNQTSETRDTRTTDTAPILDHTITSVSIPTNHSSGWTSVLLDKTRPKLSGKVLSAHFESKVWNYLIFHAQLIPCAQNPPNCSQKQKLGKTINDIAQLAIQIIPLKEYLSPKTNGLPEIFHEIAIS